MAMINDPGLNEIARSIYSEPGFSVADQAKARRAWQLWTERTSQVQRLAAEQVFFLRWIQDLHAAWVHDGCPDWDAPAAGSGARPVTELRFTSESRGYRPAVIQGTTDPRPAIEATTPRGAPPAGPDSLSGQVLADTHSCFAAEGQDSPQATEVSVPILVPPAGSEASRSHIATGAQITHAAADNLPGGQVSADAHMGNAAGEPPLPEALRITPSAPVQQPSRKVAAYQQMFPELHYPVQTAAGPKPLAEFTAHDIGFRIGELRKQRQAWGGANLGDKARIEDRERLNARDRVRIAERLQNIRDAEAEEKRLKMAERELDGYEVAVIGELPPEALDACGFRRRVA